MSPRRSHVPPFWLLFGAGGLLSALLGVALVLVTGFAVPLGWGLAAPDGLSHAQLVLALQPLWVRLAAWAVISLFAWHAAHRIFYSLHDVGIPKSLWARLACYGSALAATAVAGRILWSLGA